MVGSAMQIPIDRKSPVPLARQIQAQLERLIREGVLAPGLKLPASRDLARTLGVNRATVVLAYEELVAAGWARSHVGQGTFVLESIRPRVPATAPAAPAARNGGRQAPPRSPINWSAFFSRSARIIESEAERRRALAPPAFAETGVISFAGGMPDSGLFPTDAFRRVLNDVVRDEGETLLQYYPVAGYPPLRRYLATYLLRFGLEARPDDILIVNGSQQGFDLIARTFLDPGDAVAIEQPTYPRAMQVFRALGAERLAAAKQLADLHTSALLQAAVHRFCERRLLERHATRVAREYARRRTLLLDALGHRLSDDVTWTVPQGGFSLLLTLPAGMSANALLPRALQRGVAFTPGTAFFLDEAGERTLRLSFSSVPSARIDEGVRRLAEAIKDVRRQPRVRNAERATVPLV